MSAENRYFIVTGGIVAEKIEAFFKLKVEQRAARLALKEKYGAKAVYTNNSRIVSFTFEFGKEPEGWVLERKSGGLRISGKTAAGRKELETWKLPEGDATDLTFAIIGVDDPFHFMDGRTMNCRFMGTELLGKTRILTVPRIPEPNHGEAGKEGCKWSPPDEHTREIKTSEYFHLKEQSESVKS